MFEWHVGGGNCSMEVNRSLIGMRCNWLRSERRRNRFYLCHTMRNVQYTITIAHRQFSSRTWLCIYVYVCVYVILLTHWLDWLPSLVTLLKLTDSSATAQVSYTSQYLQEIVHFYNDIRVCCCDSCYVAH